VDDYGPRLRRVRKLRHEQFMRLICFLGCAIKQADLASWSPPALVKSGNPQHPKVIAVAANIR